MRISRHRLPKASDTYWLALIAVMDDVLGFSVAQSYIQRAEHEFGAHVLADRQPTTRRLHTSMTVARKMNHCQFGIQVMSVTHGWFGPSTTNCRLTRSGAGLRSGSRRVVTVNPRLRLPLASRLRA